MSSNVPTSVNGVKKITGVDPCTCITSGPQAAQWKQYASDQCHCCSSKKPLYFVRPGVIGVDTRLLALRMGILKYEVPTGPCDTCKKPAVQSQPPKRFVPQGIVKRKLFI